MNPGVLILKIKDLNNRCVCYKFNTLKNIKERRGEKMLRLLPEPKRAIENNGYNRSFKALSICFENLTEEEKSQYLEIANLRFWNRKDLPINENDTSESA